MRLALRILRPHSLTLTLTLSLSHCLSHLSHLSHLFLISLISLSSLSLSLSSLSLVFPSLFSLFSRRRKDPGKEPHIKDSSPLPPKRAPCFFLPRCPPLSHSGALAFAPPLASSLFFAIPPFRWSPLANWRVICSRIYNTLTLNPAQTRWNFPIQRSQETEARHQQAERLHQEAERRRRRACSKKHRQ